MIGPAYSITKTVVQDNWGPVFRRLISILPQMLGLESGNVMEIYQDP
jgi:hypothetical protein